MYNSRPQRGASERVKEQSVGEKKCKMRVRISKCNFTPAWGVIQCVAIQYNKMQFKQPEPLSCDISWVPAWINMRKSRRARLSGSVHCACSYIGRHAAAAAAGKSRKTSFPVPPHHRCAGERAHYFHSMQHTAATASRELTLTKHSRAHFCANNASSLDLLVITDWGSERSTHSTPIVWIHTRQTMKET
jgi:hypothetical protein